MQNQTKKRTLPKQVEVFGHKIKVTEKDLDDGNDGSFSLRKMEIFITPEAPWEERQKTLFHEVLHAALHLGGLSYMLQSDMEEAVVRCLEHAIWPLVKWR